MAEAERVQVTAELLERFASTPGRAVYAVIRIADASVEFGAAADDLFPAASLVKLPLVMAVERAMANGLDPDQRVHVSAVRSRDPGPLHALVSDPELTVADLVGLTIALSDNDSAHWLARYVDLTEVRAVIADAGCRRTTLSVAQRAGVGPYEGATCARDAVTLLSAACDPDRHPLTAKALANSVHASRIPLGATEHDVALAHKTGTLRGVAHDVARLECDTGSVLIAFLSRDQHDTLVTGYEMGICTRNLLQLWRLGVRHTVGLP